MSKLAKRALPIFILTILALSMMPAIMPVAAIIIDDVTDEEYPYPAPTPSNRDKGSQLRVVGSDVTAGFKVKLYWDNPAKEEFSDGEGLLNTTEADADGTFEIWFKVPEAKNGDHNLWVYDTQTGDYDMVEFDVTAKTDAPSSSLPAKDITVKGYGFSKNKDVAILLSDGTYPSTTVNAEELDEGDGIEVEYSGKTDNKPIVPGSVTVTVGAIVLLDDGDGDLLNQSEGVEDAYINYVTGEWEIEFSEVLGIGVAILADYNYYEDVADTLDVLSTTATTNKVGSWSKTVEVSDYAYGDYEIYAYDEKDINDLDDFDIGSVIELDVEEGPVGTIVQIKGAGFSLSDAMNYAIEEGSVTLGGIECYIIDEPVMIKRNGQFTAEIIIPGVDDEDDYDLTVIDNGTIAATFDDWEVTGLPALEFDPEFGPAGTEITIRGYNFSTWVDTDAEPVVLTLPGGAEEEYDTDADGKFEGTFIVPAVTTDVYTLTATQEDYGIEAEEDFRIGLMVIILSPSSGPTGKLITITGMGFTEGEEWNATIGGETIFDVEYVDGDGTFSDTFYVPSIDVDTYDLIVTDVDTEIEVTAEFEVKDTTFVEFDPDSAPQDFNVSVHGEWFGQDETALEFVIYNVTADGVVDYEDVMEVWVKDVEIEVTDDGNFTGWWDFNDGYMELSNGVYLINVTDVHDLFAQTTLTVVSETVTIVSHKTEFSIGDTVTFDINTNFEKGGTTLKIWAPDGDLYWKLEFVDDDFEKLNGRYNVPFFTQVDTNGNPLDLTSDAPTGTWSWTWFDAPPDDDEELGAGSFTVAVAPAVVLEERISDLETAIGGLSTDVSGLSDDISGVSGDVSDLDTKVSGLEGKIGDVTKDVEGIVDEAVSEGMAAVDTKIGALEQKIGGVESKVAEADAKVGGLSTLVYGAIAASLVAALAAIVSLMQISRRIAG